jgi:hypothetical protein
MARTSISPASRLMMPPGTLTVGPGYFKTMQIPILAGRDIEERDQPGTLPVAVINEVFAKANFGNQSPLGQHLIAEFNQNRHDMEIVNVSRNARYGGLKRHIPPVVFMPYSQALPPPRWMVMNCARQATRWGMSIPYATSFTARTRACRSPT